MMKRRNKVSVIIGLYNGGDDLGSCMECLIRERWSGVEMIIIKDG